MLFNEPKLLKSTSTCCLCENRLHFSALQRAEIAEIMNVSVASPTSAYFSALQRAEIAEIRAGDGVRQPLGKISVLFNEPKLLKSDAVASYCAWPVDFSALQRAEIAEIWRRRRTRSAPKDFSALQRAEIAEISTQRSRHCKSPYFSALQRAEIAEIAKDKLPELVSRLFQCSSTSRNC